jgi:hypothetical protein
MINGRETDKRQNKNKARRQRARPGLSAGEWGQDHFLFLFFLF